ncbi:uncharacterized protein BDZ99DRAFT_452380 [Mytilinidion resinicola]|uniref:HRQ family protein n=1 Tax=Mytilinidion resinicola TaxID=574789 RepID=A0A6A6Y582_9PEZI|nr:uncharacterized protein BDZ99DRAFT_452380 [Mytilinidion resinicola]KAF2803952.1 hypothetical protein BDZ99DRAFT_452380 [Mytilinidion resinicola]
MFDLFYSSLLGGAAVVVALVILTLNKQRRDVVLGRLHISRRRNSGSNTPPRSLSPDKKEKKEDIIDFTIRFPPSRRFTLTGGEKPGKTEALERPASQTPLPMKTSYLDAGPDIYLPAEFSIEEIKALGDFPDYAKLSGVPLPQPYHQFDINKALPRPYRPLRWAYHQTMSYKKMQVDWWLELENNYRLRIKQRQDLYAEHGKNVLDSLPGSELACKELMEMSLQFLVARYPHYFRLDKDKMIFHNAILNTESHLKTTDPLEVILNNIPEDFAIMLREPDTGYYFFRAGVICSSLGWDLGSKMGMQLHEIHAPIPDYETMRNSMDKYFSVLPTDLPIQRGSWGLEVDEPLYMPPGHPHEKHRDVQHADLDITRCNLRVDWQTLRRLPLSSGIVFNFKAIFTPVQTFRDEPYVPALLLKILKEGKKSLMEYKNTWHTEHVVIPSLEEYAKEQVERGIVLADWEVGSLDEYPWFPGWEEKWHKEQGY